MLDADTREPPGVPRELVPPLPEDLELELELELLQALLPPP